MTSFETVALIVLIALAIATVILKSWKNHNDGNEANDEEIKGYVFDGIDDIMSTIKVISGRTVEDTKDYVVKETVKKLTTLREESGIKFNLSSGTLTELVTAVIDNNFSDAINDYVKECEACGQEDCTCDEVESEEACEDIDTVEPTTEEVPEETPTEKATEEAPVEEEDTTEEIPVEEAVEEEVADEVVEEATTEEAPVEEVISEEEPETTDVHTTESCTCIECMTKPQIKAWAADHGIFVSSKMLKNDMIAKVKTEFEAQTAEK